MRMPWSDGRISFPISGRTDTWKGPGLVRGTLVLCGSLQLRTGWARNQSAGGWWIHASCQLSGTWHVVLLQDLWRQGPQILERCQMLEQCGPWTSWRILDTKCSNTIWGRLEDEDLLLGMDMMMTMAFAWADFFHPGLLDDPWEEEGTPSRAQELQQEGVSDKIPVVGTVIFWPSVGPSGNVNMATMYYLERANQIDHNDSFWYFYCISYLMTA